MCFVACLLFFLFPPLRLTITNETFPFQLSTYLFVITFGAAASVVVAFIPGNDAVLNESFDFLAICFVHFFRTNEISDTVVCTCRDARYQRNETKSRDGNQQFHFRFYKKKEKKKT